MLMPPTHAPSNLSHGKFNVLCCASYAAYVGSCCKFKTLQLYDIAIAITFPINLNKGGASAPQALPSIPQWIQNF